MEAAEEILLDLNALAEGHPFLALGAYAVSDDGNWLAYSLDTTGYRQYTLRVKDLRTGELSTEQIERTGSVVWAADNRTIFYTTEDAVSKRSDRFWRHIVGAGRERAGVRRDGRALRPRARASRSTRKIIFVGVVREDVAGDPLLPRRPNPPAS